MINLIQKNRQGFTLIELLLVISIISFLSSVILVSVKVARDKAVTAKITEDLRQVRIALELNYGDTGQYDIISVKNGSKVPDNVVSNVYDRNFFIKRVHAQPSLESIPVACTLFNQIAQELVDKKYLNSIPVHPRQDYSQGICYKAVKSENNASLAVYAETPARIGLTVSSPAKNVGFVLGDTSVSNLNSIRSRSKENNIVKYLQTTDDQPITDISQIADEVIGITRGSTAYYGFTVDTSSGSSGGTSDPRDPSNVLNDRERAGDRETPDEDTPDPRGTSNPPPSNRGGSR
jgi:prepilin-type N-terminal cleavage/methylation domain-containing protein